MRLVAATGASLQFRASGSNPVDPANADRAFQAACSLAAALPYNPSADIEAPLFSDLAS